MSRPAAALAVHLQMLVVWGFRQTLRSVDWPLGTAFASEEPSDQQSARRHQETWMAPR